MAMELMKISLEKQWKTRLIRSLPVIMGIAAVSTAVAYGKEHGLDNDHYGSS